MRTPVSTRTLPCLPDCGESNVPSAELEENASHVPSLTSEPVPALGRDAAWRALARSTNRRALWAPMLELMRERIEFADALLAFPYAERMPAEMRTPATPPKGAEEFLRLSADATLAVSFSDARSKVHVAEVSEELTPEVWERTSHYQKLFMPRDWHYSLTFFFRHRGRFFSRVTLSRSREQRNFTAVERAAALELHTPFAAAIGRVWEIEKDANAAGVLSRTMRDLPQAMALFDEAGHLVWSTRAGQVEAERWGAGPDRDSDFPLPSAAIQAIGMLRASWIRVPFNRVESSPPPPILCHHPQHPELRFLVSAEPPATPGGPPLYFIQFLEAVESPLADPSSPWLNLLTVGERRVAEAVCRGLTNGETAAELYLSVHTVAAHLREIFAKLGVSSRHALTARLAGRTKNV